MPVLQSFCDLYQLLVALGTPGVSEPRGNGHRLVALPCCRKLELPRAPAWGMLHQSQYSRANSSGVDPPWSQPHTWVSRLAQKQLPLILQLFPGFRSGLTSAALASTGDLPAGLEAALGGWARDGPAQHRDKATQSWGWFCCSIPMSALSPTHMHMQFC